jgi:hypothetical protein
MFLSNMRQNCRSILAVNVPTQIFKKIKRMKRFPFATRKLPKQQVADCIEETGIKFPQKIIPGFQKIGERNLAEENPTEINLL